MNQEQMTSIVRQILLSFGGALASYGVTQDAWTQLAGGLAMVLVGGGFALYTRRQQGLLNAALTSGGATKIEAPPAVAAANPDPRVVSH